MKVVVTEKQYKKIIQESQWYNTVGDIIGIFDPTGVVDFINGISYFAQGDHLFGILSMISVFPYVGDIVGKPVMGAMKIGSAATKELKVAMDLAKAGKTVEASASLAKLAKEPGVVGNFLRKAESWSPKVQEAISKLPAGPFKGFKNLILDYLKLFEKAGAKSSKFAVEVEKLAKNTRISPAQQVKNIEALQNLLKTEKIFDKAVLSKPGVLSQVFLGGVPKLFGNRRMRILMKKTKFWLGFLDWVGLGNFVGPDEAEQMLGKEEFERKMNEYIKTNQAQKYAEEDFGNEKVEPETDSGTPKKIDIPTKTVEKEEPSVDLGNVLSSVFGVNPSKLFLPMVSA